MPAEAGHGSLIAMETTSPGVFVTIAELNGDITWPALSREASDTTPHQNDIATYVFGVLGVGELTFSCNLIYDHATHGMTTGLYSKIITKETFGMRVRGPAGTTEDDEWIMSGQVTNITQTAPVRTGARTVDVTFQPSGTIIIDGEEIGSVDPN